MVQNVCLIFTLLMIGFSYGFSENHKGLRTENRFLNGQRYKNEEGAKGKSSLGSNCAIVYKGEDPVGVLKPSQDSFELLPLSGENILVEIDNDEMQVNENGLNFIDKREVKTEKRSKESYPSIITRFKIDNKITDEKLKAEREARSPLKPVVKSSVDIDKQVEQQISSILNDMGLLDKDSKDEKKRDILKEDENLEEGTNKINLIENSRDKRSDEINKEKETSVESSVLDSTEEALHGGCNSGDCKSCKNIHKREISYSKEATKAPIDDSKLAEYEEKVENNIRQKIKSLKEQVKREIEALKATERKRRADDSLRKKRSAANTLLDEETDELNPAINLDGTPKPQVRRRRSAEPLPVGYKTRKLKSDDDNYDDIKKEEQNSKLKAPEHSHGDDCENGNCSVENNCKCENADCKNCQKNGRLIRATQQELVPALEENNYETYDDEGNKDKREAIEAQYYVDLHPEGYRLAPDVDIDSFKEAIRAKRDISSKLNDNSIRNHLLSIKSRSMLNDDEHARSLRRIFHMPQSQPQQLSDMTDEELFGALPQNFEGDLARYKRVKRTKVKH